VGGVSANTVGTHLRLQMEYGLILPKPGDEPKWFADNADALLPAGHFLPEEAPDPVLAALAGFLGGS
jgi:hypothetical protein